MFGFFKKSQTIDICAPIAGEVVDITAVPDDTFAQKMLGDGIAIKTQDNTLFAPCDGTIAVISETKHALVLKNGKIEILIHVGLDTVDLNGEGFNVYVSLNDNVKQGDRLLTFDRELLLSKGKTLITPLVVLNMDQVKSMEKNFGLVNDKVLIIGTK